MLFQRGYIESLDVGKLYMRKYRLNSNPFSTVLTSSTILCFFSEERKKYQSLLELIKADIPYMLIFYYTYAGLKK